MNNKTYLTNLVSEEADKIKQNRYIKKLIAEEYQKIKETAPEIRDTLSQLDYIEKGNELDNGGPMQSHASELFILFFEFLKKELPNVKIKVSAGNDKFHHGLDSSSRHVYGEALDFTVTKGDPREVWKVLKKFKTKHSSDFKCLDEYTNPTEHATGKHFHIAYVGSDSVYAKAKLNGELPTVSKSGATYGDAVAGAGNISVSEFNSIHKWEGEDTNGTSLEEIDKALYDLAKLTSGGGKGTSIKLQSFSAGGFADTKKVTSHKWIVTCKLMAPVPEDPEKAKEDGLPVPNKDGYLPGLPETIVFYPSGNAYLYNQKSNSDVELEPGQTWVKRMLQLMKYTPGNIFTMAGVWYGGSDNLAKMATGQVIHLNNASGDILGTLTHNDNELILDLSDSPQFDVDDNYEVKGTEKWMNRLQTLLDWIGFIPVIGDIVDIVNALIYYLRGKYLEAALSCIAIIPVVGSVIKFGVKGAMKAQKLAARQLGKGALKKVKSLGALGRAITKGSAKKLFMKGAKGEKAAYELIDALVNSKPPIVTLETLAKANPKKLKSIFTSKTGKAKRVFKKYMKDADINNLKTDGNPILDAFEQAGDNLAVAIAKHQDDALKAVDLSKFGPKATTGYGSKGWNNLSKAEKEAAKKAAKKAAADAPSSGMLSKLTLNGPVKWFKKRGSKMVERLRNHFRLPAKRVEMIDDWMLKHVTDELMANPKLLDTFLKSVGSSKQFSKKLGSNQYWTKLAPGQKQKLFKKIVENDKDLIIRQMMAHPDVYFGAQLKYGLASMKTPKGLYRAMRSALGPKTYDIVYNEMSEALWKEGGVDVGGYGDEQQSVITWFMFKLFVDEQRQIARRKGRITRVQEIAALAGMLNMVGIDVTRAMSFVERKQIIDGTLNSLPGDSPESRLAWIKLHGAPADVKIIEPFLLQQEEPTKDK